MSDTESETTELEQYLTARAFTRQNGRSGVTWEGRVADRRVVLTINRQARTRYAGEVRYRKTLGYRLRISIATSIRTRLFFILAKTTRSWLIRRIYAWRRYSVLEHSTPGLDSHRIVAADPAWAEQLAKSEEAMDAVKQLVTDDKASVPGPSVYLMPQEFHYGSGTLQWADFTAERVKSTLDGMQEFVNAAEKVPAQTKVVRASRYEQLSEKNPRKAAYLLIGVVLGVVMLMSAVFIGLLLWFAMR